MLTRRTFLTTIAAAPLARFCKTEPVRPYEIDRATGVVYLHEQIDMPLYNAWLRKIDGKPAFNWQTGQYDGRVFRFDRRVENKADVERRYALPQGTLG